MKSKDIKALHQKTTQALEKELEKQISKLQKTRLEIKAGKQKDLHLAIKIRHHIARLKTILSQKENQK